MRYSDRSEQAAEFVRLALPFMAQHGIPPSPPHYRVWYDYVSGRNQKLKESVDRALNVHNGISAEFSEELYQRFVEHDDDLTAENLRHEVKTLLADALTKLAESDNQASHYGRVLEDYSKRLSINPGREQLRRALQDLLAETRAMQEANHRLEERLSETNAELERLREELDDARHTDPVGVDDDGAGHCRAHQVPGPGDKSDQRIPAEPDAGARQAELVVEQPPDRAQPLELVVPIHIR